MVAWWWLLLAFVGGAVLGAWVPWLCVFLLTRGEFRECERRIAGHRADLSRRIAGGCRRTPPDARL